MNARSSKLAAKMWSWSVEKLRVATQIDRYQARLILVPLMATLALAAMLLLLEKMLRLFDFVVSEGGPVNVVWRMLANLIPEYLGLGIPIGLMLGILLAFRRLALSSELDALRSVGLGYGRLLVVPYLFTALLLAANLIIIGFVQPRAQYAYEGLRFELRSGALGASITVGEFTSLGRGMTLRVERSENEGTDLHGVFLRTESRSGRTVAVTAERGSFLATDDPDTILFRLRNGRLVHDAPGYRTPRVLSFVQHDLPISLPSIEAFRRRGNSAEELNLAELIRVGSDRRTPEERRNGVADLHILLSAIAFEEIVVGKRLETRGFPHGQAAALLRVRVNEIMPVLGDVAGDGRGRLAPQLDTETVGKLAGIPVAVIRRQSDRR